jgi:hypothetical protein
LKFFIDIHATVDHPDDSDVVAIVRACPEKWKPVFRNDMRQ